MRENDPFRVLTREELAELQLLKLNHRLALLPQITETFGQRAASDELRSAMAAYRRSLGKAERRAATGDHKALKTPENRVAEKVRAKRYKDNSLF